MLYNDISVNFKANKAALDATGYTDVYAVFEFCGNTYTVRDYTIDKITVNGEKVDAYVFAFKRLAPDRMTDTIIATLYGTFNGTEYASASVEYSVAQYCYNQLNRATTKTALATLCVDLLNYGTEAQRYTKYNLDNLANAKLTDAQKVWGTQETREYVNSRNLADAPTVELAEWKSASLMMRDDITAYLKFRTDDISGLYVDTEINGRKYVYTEFIYEASSGYYIVPFDKFNATQLSEVFTAVIRNADGEAVSKVLTYSVESYAASKKDDQVTGALAKAMMKYGDSASALAEEQN
jgi:hypothetical protein